MPHTNPRAFVDLLEVFRICTLNKVIDKQHVISWADAIIQHDDVPDNFIIELAMCGSRSINDMASVLNEYIGESKPPIAGRVALGVLYQEYTAGRIDLYRVVRTFDWLWLNSDFTDEEHNIMSGVDDRYCLAAEGVYGSVPAVANYVLCFLACYQAFRLENREEWSDINDSIPGQLQAIREQLIALWN